MMPNAAKTAPHQTNASRHPLHVVCPARLSALRLHAIRLTTYSAARAGMKIAAVNFTCNAQPNNTPENTSQRFPLPAK